MLDSDTFKKAVEEVFLISEGPIYTLLAPEQGMALAVQRGVRDAFKHLRRVAKHVIPYSPPTSKSLSRTKHTTETP